MFLFKKSVSPLIATILIIVISVILITVVLSWGKNFTENKLSSSTISTEKDLEYVTLPKSYILSSHFPNYNSILLQNTSDKNITVVSYKLISPNNNYKYLNKDINVDSFNIFPGELKPFPIICFPDETFILLLKTDKDQYISVNINTGYLKYSGYCLGESGLIFREDFDSEEAVIENGGAPLNVIYENGVGIFNGTSSYIIYNKPLNGTYTFRIIIKDFVLNDYKYLMSRYPDTSGTVGYINLMADGTLRNDAFDTKYINGVESSVITNTDHTELVISGISFNFLKFVVGAMRNLSSASIFNGKIELFEIYNRTLTADEIKTLYDYN
jgi:hypothetical protein